MSKSRTQTAVIANQTPQLPAPGTRARWGGLHNDSLALALATASAGTRPLVIVTPDTQSAERLQQNLGYFSTGTGQTRLNFPDWETLPYDAFSPHQDIVSQRVACLYRLPELHQGTLILPVATLLLDVFGLRDRFPIVIEADLGHNVDNVAVPVGADAALDVTDTTVTCHLTYT